MQVTLSNLSQLLAGAALMAAALGAQAQSNLNFLNDTPITYFSKADVASLTKAVHQARDQGKDGETTEWNNGNRGVRIEAKLTPSTLEQDGHACREIATEINAKGQSMTLRPRYCKTPAGKWQLQKR